MIKAKKWNTCPLCCQITNDLLKHSCPPKIKAKKQADMDMYVYDEMIHFGDDLKEFWDSKDVKFVQYLINKGQI